MVKNKGQKSAAEPASAAERFRAELRARLSAMRENARRIGASSAYIESLDRSANVVLTAITRVRSDSPADTDPPVAPVPPTQTKRPR